MKEGGEEKEKTKRNKAGQGRDNVCFTNPVDNVDIRSFFDEESCHSCLSSVCCRHQTGVAKLCVVCSDTLSVFIVSSCVSCKLHRNGDNIG